MAHHQERGLPLTSCALALERHPSAARAIRDVVDVRSHGWRWIKHFELSKDGSVRYKAVQSLTATIGERPLGWYRRYGPNNGVVWWSRRVASYMIFRITETSCRLEDVSSKRHPIIPYSLTRT